MAELVLFRCTYVIIKDQCWFMAILLEGLIHDSLMIIDCILGVEHRRYQQQIELSKNKI